MANERHPSTDRWRVVVSRGDGPAVLFVKSGRSLALPEVRLPRRQRVAWHLNDQVKQIWQLPVVSIMPLTAMPSGTAQVRYHLAESLAPHADLSPNLQWIEPAVALQQFALDPQDLPVLDSLGHLKLRDTYQQSPFARLGWFQEVSLWLRSAAAALSLEWEGDFEQFNATDSFSLIRFATKPWALWLKAVGSTFASEFRVLRLLARKLPDCVPRLVAVREEWLAWLTEDCPGTTLDTVTDFGMWQNAVSALARLQIASSAFVPELLDAQAHPLYRMLSHTGVEHFRSVAREVLSASAQSTRETISDDDLADIQSTVRQCIDTTANSGVPDALGHLDLNSGNVVVSQDRSTYLDWAEAYVGFPFLSFGYLLQSFRRVFGTSSAQEQELVEIYLSPWETFAPPHAVRCAWAATPVLAVLAYFLRCIDRCEGEIRGVPGRL